MLRTRIRALQQWHRVTVLVPAYNAADTVADTVLSLQAQTHPPAEITVIDDCSTDGTARVARAAGARVLRPPRRTGSKAGAQNFALPYVRTEFVVAVDADTVVARDALEKLLPSFELSQVVAACGFVLPRHARTLGERRRYIEYLFAFPTRPEDSDRPRVRASGCFSMYRTRVLRAQHGWPAATATEDMDLTLRLYQSGYGISFVPTAVCYPIEPAPTDGHGANRVLPAD
jgi:poly-beta-1,6-N-acetyl-D-glucosamine synthase